MSEVVGEAASVFETRVPRAIPHSAKVVHVGFAWKYPHALASVFCYDDFVCGIEIKDKMLEP